MKNILKLAALSIVAFASCVKEANVEPENKGKELHFVITTGETEVKSCFDNNLDGTYSAIWSKGDELAIFVGDINENTKKPSAIFSNVNENGNKATFEGTATMNDEEGTFRSFSPAEAFATGYKNGNAGINLKEEQKPTSLTIDESCDILVSKPCYYLAEEGEVLIDGLHFKRIFSVLKVNLTGVKELEGEKVKSFTITAPLDVILAGRASVDLSNADVSSWNIKRNAVTASYSEDAPSFGDSNGLDNAVWLVVNATSIPAESEVVFSAETENYYISKKVTLTKDLVFPGSKLAVINLKIEENNIEAKIAATKYNLVTDASELTLNSEIIIAAAEDDKAMGAQNNNNRSAVDITKSEDKLSVDNIKQAQVFVVKKGIKDNSIAFYAETGDPLGYIYAAGGSNNNHLKTQSELDANASWTVTFDDKGIAKIISLGDGSRNNLQYNSSSNLFSCYSSGQKYVCIYKKEGTGEEPVPAEEYSIIKADAVNGSFTVKVAGVEADKAENGKTVSLEAIADAGYRFAFWTVTDASGSAVEVTGNTFIMPASDVTVAAEFEEAPELIALDKPTTLMADLLSDNEILVIWGAVENAGSYVVTATPAVGAEISKEVNETEYTFTDLAYETAYTISVYAKPANPDLYKDSDVAVCEEVITTGVKPAEEIVPGTYEIIPNDAFWGTNYNGSFSLKVNGFNISSEQNHITVSMKNNSSTNGYINASQTRVYDTYEMTFSVPAGYSITAIGFTNGNTWTGKHIANVGNMTDNKNWKGMSNSVTITFKGKCYIDGISVTFVEGESPVELKELLWTNYKPTYTVGDIFNVDGDIHAVYSDGSSKPLAASDVDVKTEPNLLAAGTTEAVISYTEDGITVCATAEITVKDVSQGGDVPGEETEITIDLTAQGYGNAAGVTVLTVDGITLTFNIGTNNNNAPKYYTSGTAVRLYAGNTLTVSGKTVTKVVFTYGSNDGSNAITADSGTFDNGTWTGEAASVLFTVGGTSGNRRIAKVAVTAK